MFGSIVVPLDGSRFSEYALPHARTVARHCGADLHLVHVYDRASPGDLLSVTPYHYEGVDLKEYEEVYLDEDRSYLDRLARRIDHDGQVPITTTLLRGEVRKALEEYAEDVEAGLVVMSTHGRTGVSRAWLGSVADTLVRHVTLPMLLVRPLPDVTEPPAQVEIRRILVPLDGSPRARNTLAVARTLAEGMGARLILLHAVSSRMVVGARSYPVRTGHLEERWNDAEEYLERAAEPLREAGLEVETRVLEHDEPHGAILAAAGEEGADVIAMATHGHSGLARAVLGSVTDKVLRGSVLPVLVQGPRVSEAAF